MPRYHDRDCFYKYVTSDVAKLIIKDHTLRWSCPAAFNDPFDHRFAFISEDQIPALTELLQQRARSYVWDRDDIEFDPCPPFGPILVLLKQMKAVVPQEEFLRRFEAIRQRIVESGTRALAYFNEETNHARLQTRVLCLAEENDNLLMWSHYSASHTGAVFKLNAVGELDVPLLVAKKVTYSMEYPLFATEEELIDHLLYVHRIDFAQRERDLLLVKGHNWQYENEWRVSITDEAYPLGGAIDFKEPPEVFGAIYLGCRMAPGDEEEIGDLADRSLPKMEIWKAVEGRMGYKLEFKRLK